VLAILADVLYVVVVYGIAGFAIMLITGWLCFKDKSVSFAYVSEYVGKKPDRDKDKNHAPEEETTSL